MHVKDYETMENKFQTKITYDLLMFMLNDFWLVYSFCFSCLPCANNTNDVYYNRVMKINKNK